TVITIGWHVAAFYCLLPNARQIHLPAPYIPPGKYGYQRGSSPRCLFSGTKVIKLHEANEFQIFPIIPKMLIFVLEQILAAMDAKQQELLSRITIKPGLMGGRPTVRGLRFPVGDILELLASGLTEA